MHAEVRRCVENKDFKGLKYIFADCLVVDPTFEKYREDYEYCKKVAGVFEAYKELTPLQTSKSQWNVEYWERIKLDLLENFSTKRFDHMVEVAKVVYADKVSRLLKERKSVEIREQHREEVQTGGQERNKSAKPVNPTGRLGQNLLDVAHQEEQLESARKKLELENQKIAEEERRQRERIAARKAEYEKHDSVSGNNATKKVSGIVFVVAALIIIVIILMKVL